MAPFSELFKVDLPVARKHLQEVAYAMLPALNGQKNTLHGQEGRIRELEFYLSWR